MAGHQGRDRFHGRALDHPLTRGTRHRAHSEQHHRARDRRLDRICRSRKFLVARCRQALARHVLLRPHSRLRFASALQEFGLPRGALVPALASFNLGVEIGQIAIVSLVVPALLGMDRLLARWDRTAGAPTRSAAAVYGISAVIIGLGGYWFMARTLLAA